MHLLFFSFIFILQYFICKLCISIGVLKFPASLK